MKLSKIQGQVYDISYTPPEKCWNSAEAFINDACDKEIETAMKDFPNDYENDELYQNAKRIKNSQEISVKELRELLDAYRYSIVVVH